MAFILSASNVLTPSFPFLAKALEIGSIDMPRRMDRFLWIEDEVFDPQVSFMYYSLFYVLYGLNPKNYILQCLDCSMCFGEGLKF